MLNIFYRDKTEYTNKLDPLTAYVTQLTEYIKNTRNVSPEEARRLAIQLTKANFKNPEVRYFEREENGDRTVKKGPLLNYINSNIKDNNVLAPTFTSYQHATKNRSILSEFIFINVKKRGIAKKAMHKAKAENQMQLYEAKNNEQNLMKTYNNSLSGIFGQMACVLYNPTAHNTLTTITRTMTSLGNANNERLIAGNRYYPRPIDVLNNINYIATYTDIELIQKAIQQFNLHIPTVEDTVQVLKRSSDLYFNDLPYYQNYIIPYLQSLSPYQLAGICYYGDFYHLRQFNQTFVRDLLTKMIQKLDCSSEPMENYKDIYTIDENILNFVHHVYFDQMKGRGKDYEKMNEDGMAYTLYRKAKHIEALLQEYKLFFNTFFMSKIFPNNSFRLRNMRRRTVVLSDTDSTCFTLDDWVTWYKGQFTIDEEGIALASCITYITSQVIVNLLAMVSSNMNVETEQINTLAMKNEYLWLLHVPCEVSKHYFASTVTQEGNVFEKSELEVKGVHLKNSAVPKHIIKDASTLMSSLLETVSSNKKIKFNEVLKHIIDIEKEITESVYKGEAVYLKRSKIKEKDAYSKDELKSPYHRHVLWRDVFAEKYGDIQEPPYDVVKIPTTVRTNAKLKDWFETIEDIELKGRLLGWIEKHNKKNLPTIYLDIMYVIGNGIPDEIRRVIDVKRIVLDVTIQHRMILETLGVMLYDDMLIQEQFKL